jgi:hypothetical protein
MSKLFHSGPEKKQFIRDQCILGTDGQGTLVENSTDRQARLQLTRKATPDGSTR